MRKGDPKEDGGQDLGASTAVSAGCLFLTVLCPHVDLLTTTVALAGGGEGHGIASRLDERR